MPSGTLYGVNGDSVPASFIDWTEDAQPFNPSGDGSHYIPVSLSIVGGRVIDPRRNSNFSFEDYPEQTIWCQLPQMAISGITIDSVVASLSTTTQHQLNMEVSGSRDIVSLVHFPVPFPVLSGVAVPVRSVDRYGDGYPDTWQSGNADEIVGVKVVIDDDLAPWVEFPQGQETSVEVLNRRAFDKMNSILSFQEESQYVTVGQVGLPRLSFDTFAVQTVNVSGMIGAREHGVNEVNITYGTGGLKTSYKAESYYNTPRKPSPLEDRTRARLEGVIQPIDFLDLSDFIAEGGPGDPGDGDTDPPGAGGSIINTDFDRQEACEVINVNNIFDESACDKLLNGQTVPTEEQYFVEITRNQGFVYVTSTTLAGLATTPVGHTLNSLDVTVTVVPEDNQYQSVGFLSLEVDQHTVVIQNPSVDDIEATIMITNREGSIRPTNETIRNSEDTVATYAGVFCQDGYLNVGDACVYIHKRVESEEFAYLTGGRKLAGGQVITVESANDDGTYNVSMLGDRHGRWMCSIGTLNDVAVGVATQAQLAEAGTAEIKPGPETNGYVVNPPSAGGGTPVQIISLEDTTQPPGYPDGEPGVGYSPIKVATVQELTASGILATETYSNVHILPDPSFGAVGDKGLMVTYTPNGGILSNVRYISLNKGEFTKYSG
jgi:hypothetical protein